VIRVRLKDAVKHVKPTVHGTQLAMVEGVVMARVSAFAMPVEPGKTVGTARTACLATIAAWLVTGQKRAMDMVVAQEMALVYATKALRDHPVIHVCLTDSEVIANEFALMTLVVGMGAAKRREMDAYVMMAGAGMLVMFAPLDSKAFAMTLVPPMRHVMAQVVAGMMELASVSPLSTVAACTTPFYSRVHTSQETT
jgi:hypothetical protein